MAAGPDIDVSNDSGVQSQVSIAVDPTNNRLLVAGCGKLGEQDTGVQLDRRWLQLDGKLGSATPRRRPRRPARSVTRPSAIDRLGRQYYAFIVGLHCDLASAARSGSPSCSSPTVPTPPHPGRLRHAQSPPSTPATRFVTARQTTSPGLPSTSRRRALTPTVPMSSGRAPVAPRESGFCSATRTTARTPGLRPCA